MSTIENRARTPRTMARYPRVRMRALVLSVALLAVGCTTIGGSSSEDAEAAARGALSRDHVTDITLTQVDDRTFDFTGMRDGERCVGTVVTTIRGRMRSAAIQSRCE